MTHQWIKVPGPGEFRGEGQWMTIEDFGITKLEWEAVRATAYLPTAEQDEKPNADSYGE